jgi:hypothetical protein
MGEWLGVATGLLAFLTAAIGVWKVTRLEVKVDGRLEQLLAKTTEVSRLLGREEMRIETDATALTLQEKTVAATLKASEGQKP